MVAELKVPPDTMTTAELALRMLALPPLKITALPMSEVLT